MRTLYWFLLLSILFLGICACSDDKEMEERPPSPIVTIIYAPDGLGDEGYNDAICKGVYSSQKEYGFRLHTVIPNTQADAKSSLKEWLEQCRKTKTRQLLLLACDSYESLVREYADQFPDDEQCSVILFESMATDLPAYTFFMPLYGASYEAGCLALQLNEVKKALVITANSQMQPLKDGIKGFSDGFSVEGNSSDFSALSENEQGYDLADQLYQMSLAYDQMYDFIYPLVGGSIQGLVRYTNESFNSFYLAGMDVDMSFYSMNIPFSVVKHIDILVKKNIEQWVNGKPLPRHQSLGLTSGMVEVIVSPISENGNKLKAALSKIHSLAIEKEEKYEAEKKQ